MLARVAKKRMPMVASDTLQLALNAARVDQLVSMYLSNRLKGCGYKSVSAAALKFLSALECGSNYASSIAVTLGVSQKMMAKTVS